MQKCTGYFNHIRMLLLKCKTGTSRFIASAHRKKAKSLRQVIICFSSTDCWGKGHVSTTCPYLTCLITLSVSLSRRNFHPTFHVLSHCIITEWESTDCMSLLIVLSTFSRLVASIYRLWYLQSFRRVLLLGLIFKRGRSMNNRTVIPNNSFDGIHDANGHFCMKSGWK